MSAQNVLDGLDVLQLHPGLTDYIKRERDFTSLSGHKHGGYNPEETAYQEQLNVLLDPDQMHSGASFTAVLFNIQLVLLGTATRETFDLEAKKDKEWYAANR